MAELLYDPPTYHVDYRKENREQYKSSESLKKWDDEWKHDDRWKFLFEPGRRDRQVPEKGFDHFWIGIHLLKQKRPRLTVLTFYRKEEYYKDERLYNTKDRVLIARKLLGPAADEVLAINQPPDFLVFDSQKRFFFCEAKDRIKLSENQRKNFGKINQLLNQNKPPCGTALRLPKEHWVGVWKLKEVK